MWVAASWHFQKVQSQQVSKIQRKLIAFFEVQDVPHYTSILLTLFPSSLLLLWMFWYLLFAGIYYSIAGRARTKILLLRSQDSCALSFRNVNLVHKPSRVGLDLILYSQTCTVTCTKKPQTKNMLVDLLLQTTLQKINLTNWFKSFLLTPFLFTSISLVF